MHTSLCVTLHGFYLGHTIVLCILLAINCNYIHILFFYRDITRKEGPNKGRWFYACKVDKCGYFKWGKRSRKTNGGLYI